MTKKKQTIFVHVKLFTSDRIIKEEKNRKVQPETKINISTKMS